MSYRKGLLSLLIVFVLGVMAFAASAEAVTPEFAIELKLALHASASGVTEGPQKLLVPASNLTLTCAEFEVLEGLILNGVDADARLLYKNCKTFEHKSPFAELPCHVSDVAAAKPELLHITLGALLLPVEFANGGFGVLAEKFSVQINFLSGTGCPLPLKNVIKGEVCFRIAAATNDKVVVLIETNPTIQTECPKRIVLEGLEKEADPKGTIEDKVLFGLNTATVEGKANVFLTGAHLNKEWGVALL